MTTLTMSKFRAAIIFAILASGSAVLQAHGQTKRVRVDVPFAFEVGSNHFAPGIYFLTDAREHVLSVSGPSSDALVLDRQETSGSPSTNSKVVFYRYGDRYFLREVWTKGNTDHLRCFESKAERQAKESQQAADRASVAAPSNVEVALLEDPK